MRQATIAANRKGSGHRLGKPIFEISPEMALKDAGMEFAEPFVDLERQARRRRDGFGCLAGPAQRARPEFLDRRAVRGLEERTAPRRDCPRLGEAHDREFDVLLALHASGRVGDALTMTDQILKHQRSVACLPGRQHEMGAGAGRRLMEALRLRVKERCRNCWVTTT